MNKGTGQHCHGQQVPTKAEAAEVDGQILTMIPFACREVVCDYHGNHVMKDWLSMLSNNGERMHVFFTDMAWSHLEDKKANIRPQMFKVNGSDVFLFIALRYIQVNAELLFNYGMQKKSFAEEGLDLHWL